VTDITCAVPIGHDLGLLKWCILNARERAWVDHDWLVYNWKNADDDPQYAAAIKDWCQVEGLNYVSYMAPAKSEFADHTAWFLHCLYNCWNGVYKHAKTPWVARMGSDQFFSEGWLKALWDAAERYGDRAVFHCWTVESDAAKHSRHPIRNWGVTWQTFDVDQFDLYAREMAHKFADRLVLAPHECPLSYLHPTRGMQLRPDSCTWLQARALWEEFGPLDDVITAEGVTGDVAVHDRMTDAGIKGYLVMKSTSFHLVRGESREVQG
jgi:hypothetical protein